MAHPLMLETLANSLFIMNKAWVRGRTTRRRPRTSPTRRELHGAQSHGHGAFILVSRDPDVKSVFKKNPNWWGLKDRTYRTATSMKSSTRRSRKGRPAWRRCFAGHNRLRLDPPVQDL
jgi:peptide/nickel transport system substrate-binding protein